MLMKTFLANASSQCRACGGEKHVQLTQYHFNGAPSMQKTCSVYEYRALYCTIENIGVDAVWCSGCGLMYHPSSI